MGKPCPLLGTAVYLDCLDCDDKQCNKKYKYKNLVIGIDQSYANTGISVAVDNKLIKVRSVYLKNYKTNSEKRKALSKSLNKLLKIACSKSENVVCIIERIRLSSKGFINMDYIKSIGALNSVIVDICSEYSVPVYSVDTRCWKSQVIGTSKGSPNKYGVPEEKWPTVKWVISKGFEGSILNTVEGRREKGTFVRNGIKYEYNNDASDSAGIAMFWFVGDKDKLKEER